MKIKKVKLIYFSPTGTTQKVLTNIAKGIGTAEVEHINLTLPKRAEKDIRLLPDELVLLGAPVYGGRLPIEAIERFERLKADNTPVVPIVVYGNREFDDALLELKNLTIELGFQPVAAGAFIGEHSFATKEIPVAIGRPDRIDIDKATSFGTKIKDKIAGFSTVAQQTDVQIPGRFPYEGGIRIMEVAPETEEDRCNGCSRCAGVCPTAAISVNGKATTEIGRCIRCSACIKTCPSAARSWHDSSMKKITDWLQKNCSARKEPELFGVDR